MRMVPRAAPRQCALRMRVGRGAKKKKGHGATGAQDDYGRIEHEK